MNRVNIIGITVLAIAFIFTVVTANTTAEELEGEIAVLPSEKLGTINPDTYGLFMELAFRQFYGGAWAEMLKMRKFEGHDNLDNQYGVIMPWYPIGRTQNTHFMHDNTVFYCGNQSQKITSREKPGHKVGIGQRNLFLEKGKTYKVQINVKQEGIQTPLVVALEGKKGVYTTHEISLADTNWNRFSFNLRSTQTDKNGSFTLTYTGAGTVWVGTASLMSEDHLSGYRKDVIKAIREIKPPNIRWPGGNFVSYYHWEDGIGDRDKRPPKPNYAWGGFEGKEWESNDVGIDEFMEFCRLVRAKPYIAINAGDGTPEEAANLVEYCNGGPDTRYGRIRAKNGHPEPYSVKLWGIGNEMFGNWQGGHVDEETYAKRHLAIAKAMRAVDPTIKLVACGGRYWKYPHWNQALFKIAGEYFDYLSLHSYAKKYRSWLKKEDLKDPKLAKETYYYIVSSPYGVEEQIIETDKEIRKAFPGRPEVTIAFDEWNAMLYRIPKVDFALRDGIYAAGIFHSFRRQFKALTLANFASAVNMIPLIRVNEYGVFFNPQYLAFKMYLNHSGPILLKSSVKCDTFSAPEYEKGRPQAIGCIPYLDVSATMSEDEKTVYVAVINLHADENIKTQISLDQWGFSPEVKFFELYDDDYMAENTFEHPDRLTIKEDVLNATTNPFSYNFKPHSVTIMKFQKK